jgi:hypothetical protein
MVKKVSERFRQASNKTLQYLIKLLSDKGKRARFFAQDWIAIGFLCLGIHVWQNGQHETHDFVTIQDKFDQDLW